MLVSRPPTRKNTHLAFPAVVGAILQWSLLTSTIGDWLTGGLFQSSGGSTEARVVGEPRPSLLKRADGTLGAQGTSDWHGARGKARRLARVAGPPRLPLRVHGCSRGAEKSTSSRLANPCLSRSFFVFTDATGRLISFASLSGVISANTELFVGVDSRAHCTAQFVVSSKPPGIHCDNAEGVI